MKAVPSSQDCVPEARIRTIRRSLQCFICGLVGLVPVVGLPFALAAIIEGRRARKAAGEAWNPAGGYLAAGRRLGPLGFLTSAAFVAVVFLVIPAVFNGLAGCSSGST